jgi:hypothetical protein
VSKTPKTFVTEVYRKIGGIPVAKGTLLTIDKEDSLRVGIISRETYRAHYEPEPVPVETPEPVPVETPEEVTDHGME